MPRSDWNVVSQANFEIPEDLEEQQKIASFLSSVDTRIEQLSSKKELLEQYKKGLMQKLFSQDLRFREGNGRKYPDWERKRLGDLFDIHAGGDIAKENIRNSHTEQFCYPVYANSEKSFGLYGFSDQYRVDRHCITVSGRGTLGIAKARFEKFYPIVRLLVLLPKDVCNLIFFENAINLLKIFKESTGVPQLTSPQLSSYNIEFPSLSEQQKIADFLSSVDKKIELVARQIDQARLFKKGLLQQMFV